MFKLMVADDNPYILQELCNDIDWGQYGISLAGSFHNGEALLVAAMQNLPDIILTDISMPGMDGIRLAQEIRQISSTVKIVFISSYAEFEYARKALSLQISDYILKPFDVEQLSCVFQKIVSEIHTTETGDSELPLTAQAPSAYLAHVNNIKEYIHAHYCEPITTQNVADAVFLSVSHANYCFRSISECSIFDYIVSIRMEEAKRLLRETDLQITVIPEMVGYKGKTNFYLAFKKFTDMSPAQYRKSCHQYRG